MYFSTFFYVLGLLVVTVRATSISELTVTELQQRLLEANLNLLNNEIAIDTCQLNNASKVLSRFRNLKVEPTYSWLQNDARVSINLDKCVATLPITNATDSLLFSVTLIESGHITQAGRGVRLSLQKKSRTSDNAHFFEGSYVPFTLGHSYATNPSDVDVRVRIGARIECTVVYCVLGATVDHGGCLLEVGGSVPEADA